MNAKCFALRFFLLSLSDFCHRFAGVVGVVCADTNHGASNVLQITLGQQNFFGDGLSSLSF